ncbi:putative membrane protein DUF2207 [Actinomadura hallensis]|uniref:Putative membrane protein DUF2207 n=1 Tax=Actinomadura hallensis TaxID=337895 RepID=A0A543IKM1_9ACTN|nr:DUF2207 domain-containing protein [Actinomadura hallensis]TQM71130.1 putative membrane protein DUF2207 [Actinomadura hallensis]
MPDVRGRVRGLAIAAGAPLVALLLALPAALIPALALVPALAPVMAPPAGAAARPADNRPADDRPHDEHGDDRQSDDGQGDDGHGYDGNGGRDAGADRPAPAVTRTLPPPETATGDLAESIATYDIVLAIGSDGVLRVRETITYDFDESGRRGIVLHVPFRRGDRLYEVRGVRAGSSTGAPSRVSTTRLLNDVQIHVGAGRHEVRGRQSYVVEYEVARAFTAGARHDELAWDAVSANWSVPIRHAAVRVEGPVPLRHVTCRAGSPGATVRCLRDRDGPYAVDFIQRGLAPGEGVRIGVRLPKRAIAVQPPRYLPPRWAGDWPGTALLAVSLGVVATLPRSRALPRRRVGTAMAAAGALLVVSDAGGEVAAHGLWAFSLGDRCLAGLALMVAGAGVVCARGLRHPPTGGRTAAGSITVDHRPREQIGPASRLPG